MFETGGCIMLKMFIIFRNRALWRNKQILRFLQNSLFDGHVALPSFEILQRKMK